eukprot:6209718-Pleurochrysis_carterae.AAC.1
MARAVHSRNESATGEELQGVKGLKREGIAALDEIWRGTDKYRHQEDGAPTQMETAMRLENNRRADGLKAMRVGRWHGKAGPENTHHKSQTLAPCKRRPKRGKNTSSPLTRTHPFQHSHDAGKSRPTTASHTELWIVRGGDSKSGPPSRIKSTASARARLTIRFQKTIAQHRHIHIHDLNEAAPPGRDDAMMTPALRIKKSITCGWVQPGHGPGVFALP